ncbi:MAG: pentapeptide repeat-containing protein [Armatimonadetes bacterium]|nr:pentapeptide repeat-containing protein [Armatimonadota bacterium]
MTPTRSKRGARIERWRDYEKPERRSLEEAWAELKNDYDMPLNRDGSPLVPSGVPLPGDEGFGALKTGYVYWEMSGYTLPRAFFGRCLIEWANFTNTDLHESRLCWNDFVDCSFRYADLSGADLRASLFVRCRFDHSSLSNADFRGSAFHDCTFSEANVSGCNMVRGVEGIRLSAEQTATLIWSDEPGAEPPGG